MRTPIREILHTCVQYAIRAPRVACDSRMPKCPEQRIILCTPDHVSGVPPTERQLQLSHMNIALTFYGA